MTPSQRIHHIRQIADALSSEDWMMVDLTLRQFSLPWQEEWHGDTRSYVIDMIHNASDSDLLDLAKHLGTAGVLEPLVSPTFWLEEDVRLFISHVSTIAKQASALRDELSKFGITSFVAHVDIEPTREWQDEIESALSTMDALVALLSPGFNESRWCDQEVGVAIGRQVPIVPVKIDLDPYGFFGKYQAIPAKGRLPKTVAPAIYDALIKKPQVASKIANSVLGKLHASSGWTESRRLVSLLERFPSLSAQHIEKLRGSIEETTAVSNASGLPEQIEKLAKRLGG